MLSFNPITGQLDFVNPAADISGKLDLTGGTVTGQLVLTGASATGAVNVSPTWNNAGTDFTGIYGRVTNTASGASSKLIDVGTVADGSLFSVSKAGALVAASLNTAGGVVGNYAALNGFSVWVGYSTAMVKTTGWTKTLQWADASIDAVPFVAIGPSANNTATLKVSDGSTGYGSIDVLGLKVSGVDGATHSGLVTSITVVNGIVTAVT